MPPFVPPLPPSAEGPRTTAAVREAAAASLAGGLIAAAGRPFSYVEAMEVNRNCFFLLWPNPGDGSYDSWKKNFDPLQKVV